MIKTNNDINDAASYEALSKLKNGMSNAQLEELTRIFDKIKGMQGRSPASAELYSPEGTLQKIAPYGSGGMFNKASEVQAIGQLNKDELERDALDTESMPEDLDPQPEDRKLRPVRQWDVGRDSVTTTKPVNSPINELEDLDEEELRRMIQGNL